MIYRGVAHSPALQLVPPRHPLLDGACAAQGGSHVRHDLMGARIDVRLE